MKALLQPRTLYISCFTLSLLIWISQCQHWWVHLEGDNPLYSVMSMQVLSGKHFLVTAGQVHGGTFLVYLRAAFFALFGVSPFLGFFVNALAVSVAVVLWARFAYLMAGPIAAWVTGLLCAIGTEGFVRPALTDYYGLSLLTGGLLFNSAHALAQKETLRSRDWFFAGLLAGISWYVCRFSALYFVPALLFFYQLSPKKRRDQLFFTTQEIQKSRIIRFFFAAVLSGMVCFAAAFFSSDRFLGMNAELTLKWIVLVAAIFLAGYRRKSLIAVFPRVALLGLGFLVGMWPERLYKILHSTHVDRVTGLVRWNEISALSDQIPFRLGLNFSFYHPLSLGLVAVFCWIGILALGLFSKKRSVVAITWVGFALPVVAWLVVHTYMHLVPQYFFPAFYPLYLAIGVICALTRFQKTAIVLASIVGVIGFSDALLNRVQVNPIQQSGVIETLEEWQSRYQTHIGFGHYPSNYNLMLATRGRWKIPWLETDERFPDFQDEARRQDKIFYIRRQTDRFAPWAHPGYRVLESKTLGNGFEAKLLQKTL